MAYLDDRARTDSRIAMMALPAVAFFAQRWVQSQGMTDSTETLDELSLYINPVIWVSPIFVIIQIARMVAGNAARSWQNILCTLVTAAAAVMLWRT